MNEGWDIVYYQAPNQNSSPVQDFIQGLEKRAQNKIVRTLELLEDFGIDIGPPYAKKLTGTELWELRILGADNIRIFYISVQGKTFLLLHGFIKKRQKTDKREIETALARLREYHSRN